VTTDEKKKKEKKNEETQSIFEGSYLSTIKLKF